MHAACYQGIRFYHVPYEFVINEKIRSQQRVLRSLNLTRKLRQHEFGSLNTNNETI